MPAILFFYLQCLGKVRYCSYRTWQEQSSICPASWQKQLSERGRRVGAQESGPWDSPRTTAAHTTTTRAPINATPLLRAITFTSTHFHRTLTPDGSCLHFRPRSRTFRGFRAGEIWRMCSGLQFRCLRQAHSQWPENTVPVPITLKYFSRKNFAIVKRDRYLTVP